MASRDVIVNVNVKQKVQPATGLADAKRALLALEHQPIRLKFNYDDVKHLVSQRSQLFDLRAQMRTPAGYEKLVKMTEASDPFATGAMAQYSNSGKDLAALKAEYNRMLQTPVPRADLTEVQQQLRQQVGQSAPGSREQVDIFRQMLAVDKEIAKASKKEHASFLEAKYGSSLGTAIRTTEKTNAGGDMAGGLYSVLDNFMVRMATANNPAMGATLTGSIQLFQGEIGMLFIPALTRFSAGLQDAAHWVRDLDPATKSFVATSATLAAGGLLSAYALSKVAQAAVATWAGLVKMKDAALLAPQMAGQAAGWAAANPRGVSLAVGAAMTAGAHLFGEDNAGGRLASNIGSGMMLGSALAPSGAGFGTAMQFNFAATAAMIVGEGLMRDRSFVAPAPPAGYTAGSRETAIETEVTTALNRFEGFHAFSPHESRKDAVREITARYGMRPETLSITSGALTGGMAGEALGPDRIRDIARTVAMGTSGRTETPESVERRARALEAEGKTREANELRRTSLIDQYKAAVPFQSEQMGLGDVHRRLQAEAVRSPLDQEKFEQMIRGLDELNRSIGALNDRIAGEGGRRLGPDDV